MQFRALSVDGRVKRWHAKVLTAAFDHVNREITSVAEGVSVDLHTECDAGATDRIEIVEHCERGKEFTVLVFSVSNWENLKQAVPDAIAQLSSAALALAPSECRQAVHQHLLGDHAAAVPVRRTTRQTRDDGLDDFYVYIEEPVTSERFFALVDRLESVLEGGGKGLVTGNSYALSGKSSCIDLAASDRVAAEEVVRKTLDGAGISEFRATP